MTMDAIDRAAIQQLRGIATQKELAEDFGVSVRTIYDIQTREPYGSPTLELLAITMDPEETADRIRAARRDLAIVGPLESFGNARVLERRAQVLEDLAPWDCNRSHSRLDAMEEEIRIMTSLGYLFGILHHGPERKRRSTKEPADPGLNVLFRRSMVTHTRVIGWTMEEGPGGTWTGKHLASETTELIIRLQRSRRYYIAMAESRKGRARIPWINLEVRAGELIVRTSSLLWRMGKGTPTPDFGGDRLRLRGEDGVAISPDVTKL